MSYKLPPSQIVQKIDEIASNLAYDNGYSFLYSDVNVSMTMDERTAHYSLVGRGKNVAGESVHLHIHIMFNVADTSVMARSLKVDGKTVDPSNGR